MVSGEPPEKGEGYHYTPMAPYDRQAFLTTADLAAVAVFAYARPGGSPGVEPVTPVLLGGEPAFTLTYARSELAREISASPYAAIVFSDSRLAYVGWTPLAVEVAVEALPDPEGRLFREELLDQELRKFPPARQIAGSMLLQRENWWYLARWILRLSPQGDPYPVGRREGPEHAVLACDVGGALPVRTVGVAGWEDARIPLRPLGPDETPLPEGVRATLFAHDFAVPDMDPRTSFTATGRLSNGRLDVEARSGSHTLGRRPGLFARWRGHKDLERRCRRGIKAAGV